MGLIGGVSDTGSGLWDWFIGTQGTGWIGAMGLIHVVTPCGVATLAGSRRWDWFMGARGTGWTGAIGLIYGGARHWLERGDGIDLWGHVMGARDCIGEMGLICGGTPWGRATRLGWWNWFVGVRHGGTWHWLDQGEGIDLCGRAMGAHDTGWIGAMGLINGGVLNDKVLYGCWI